MQKTLLFIMSIFPILAGLAGCDSTESVRNKFEQKDEFADVTFETIPEMQDIDETSIRSSFVSELNEKLSGISGYDEITSALAKLDEKNAARLLKLKLPTKADALESGEIKEFLKAYARLIAVKYCTETRVFFNHELLKMPFGDYDRTYEQFVYWRWENCLSSDDVFASSRLDYSPFTENELSVLYWSYKLIQTNPDRYRKIIAQRLHRMRILEKSASKYTISESWKQKNLKLYTREFCTMKDWLKKDLLEPEWCIQSIISSINRAKNEYLYGSSDCGSGGGGFRYRKIDRKKVPPEEKPAEKLVPSEVINKFETENLLALTEITGLLGSDVIENKIRGVIHLFRLMEKQIDYSHIDMMLNALDVESSQLVDIVKTKLRALLTTKKDENLKHVRDFIYNLFSKNVYMRSEFIDLAMSVDDKDYIDRFVKLLLKNGVTKAEDQSKIINKIVETKRTEYISKLFDWRFNTTYLKEKNFLIVGSFFAKMIKLNRDKSLCLTIEILKSKSAPQYWDIKHLGSYFFKETIGCDSRNHKWETIYNFDAKPEKISENKLYFDQICFFTIDYLRWDFYRAVARNCNIDVDQIVYEWFANEKISEFQSVLLKDFASNTRKYDLVRKFNEGDKDFVDADAIKQEIRSQEKRFTTFATYVMQSKHHEVQYELFEIAPYLQAVEAWRIIRHFFDISKADDKLGSYFKEIDELAPDSLGLIEIDKLKRYLYAYLISHLTDYRRCNALINAIEILAG